MALLWLGRVCGEDRQGDGLLCFVILRVSSCCCHDCCQGGLGGGGRCCWRGGSDHELGH